MIENQWILRPVLQFETSPKGQHHALLQDHKFSPDKTPAVNSGWKILTLRNGILHPIKMHQVDRAIQRWFAVGICWTSHRLMIWSPHHPILMAVMAAMFTPDHTAVVLWYQISIMIISFQITYHCLDYLHYFAFLHDLYSNIHYLHHIIKFSPLNLQPIPFLFKASMWQLILTVVWAAANVNGWVLHACCCNARNSVLLGGWRLTLPTGFRGEMGRKL